MGKRVTDSTAQYIQRFREIYGDKYKYPDFIRNSTHLIDIECPVHGVFQRTPHRHLKQGCPKCGPRGDPFTKFTNRARELFGDKFTYDKDTFTTSQEKMRIICPDHGEFWQELYSHVRLKHGCPKCGFESSAYHSRDDLESFLEKARQTHGDNYGYDKVNYITCFTPVDIYCKKHAAYFSQRPATHTRGGGCRTCGFERTRNSRILTDEEVNEKIRIACKGRYDFERVVNYDPNKKVKLICPIHGEFFKWLNQFVHNEHGCAKCSGNAGHTTEEFIDLARKTHGDRYDYSETVYTRSLEKVTIICPKHGKFEQKPSGHIRSGYGCPSCKSSRGEEATAGFLTRHGIDFKREYVIPPNHYRYDFYLPAYHIFIEFHGEQHYRFIDFFHGTMDIYRSRKLADSIKKEIIKGLHGKLIVANYKHLQSGKLDKHLIKKLLKLGVPVEVFNRPAGFPASDLGQ